jgi:hypothetical protein
MQRDGQTGVVWPLYMRSFLALSLYIYIYIYMYIVQCSGYWTTSDHQLYRVWVLETPFGLLIRLLQSQPHVTTITIIYLVTHLHSLHSYTPIFHSILSQSSRHTSHLTAHFMPPHSLRNCTVSRSRSLYTVKSKSRCDCRSVSQ